MNYFNKELSDSKSDSSRTVALGVEFVHNFLINKVVPAIEQATGGILTYTGFIADEIGSNGRKEYLAFDIVGNETHNIIWEVNIGWNTYSWNLTTGGDYFRLHLKSDDTLKLKINNANTKSNVTTLVGTISGNDNDGYVYSINMSVVGMHDTDFFALLPKTNNNTHNTFFAYDRLEKSEDKIMIFSNDDSIGATKSFILTQSPVEHTTYTGTYQYNGDKVIITKPYFINSNLLKGLTERVKNIYNNSFGTNNGKLSQSGTGLRIAVTDDNGETTIYRQILSMWWAKED